MQVYSQLYAFRTTDKTNILMIQIVCFLIIVYSGINFPFTLYNFKIIGILTDLSTICAGILGLYCTLKKPEVKWAKFYLYALVVAFVLYMIQYFWFFILIAMDGKSGCEEEEPESVETCEKIYENLRALFWTSNIFGTILVCCYCGCYMYCSHIYIQDLEALERQHDIEMNNPNNDNEFNIPIPLDFPNPTNYYDQTVYSIDEQPQPYRGEE